MGENGINDQGGAQGGGIFITSFCLLHPLAPPHVSRNLSASVTAACCSTLRNVRSGITEICLTRILLNVKTRKQSTRGGANI